MDFEEDHSNVYDIIEINLVQYSNKKSDVRRNLIDILAPGAKWILSTDKFLQLVSL